MPKRPKVPSKENSLKCKNLGEKACESDDRCQFIRTAKRSYCRIKSGFNLIQLQGKLDILLQKVSYASSLKNNFCKNLNKLNTDKLKALVFKLERIVSGDSSKNIPGIANILKRVVSKEIKLVVGRKYIELLIKKFDEVYAEVLYFVIQECNLPPEEKNKINITFNFEKKIVYECNGEQIPNNLLAWLLNPDEKWIEKTVLCNLLQNKNNAFEVGQKLKDDYKVVFVEKKMGCNCKIEKERTTR